MLQQEQGQRKGQGRLCPWFGRNCCSRCGPAPAGLAGHEAGCFPRRSEVPAVAVSGPGAPGRQRNSLGLWVHCARCPCSPSAGPGAPAPRDSALGPCSRPARLLRSPSAGLWAQPRLQEAGGGQRAPGDSVTLSCRGYGFSFEGFYIYWYRQAPGGSLVRVSSISSHSGTYVYYHAAVQGRATISRDNSRSEAYLSLWSLQTEDSARYFCAITREQEMQLSFNRNLPGSGRGCVRCGEGERCLGPGANGSQGCLQEFGCHHCEPQVFLAFTAHCRILLYCQLD